VLADPKFGQPGRTDLLLGVEVYSRLIRPGIIELGTDKLTLQESNLGGNVFAAEDYWDVILAISSRNSRKIALTSDKLRALGIVGSI